jgi:hypothetical protein
VPVALPVNVTEATLVKRAGSQTSSLAAVHSHRVSVALPVNVTEATLEKQADL